MYIHVHMVAWRYEISLFMLKNIINNTVNIISARPCIVLNVKSPSVCNCIQVVMIDQLMNYLFPFLF